MKIHDLQPAPGSKKRAKRVARGIGGRGGKTAGRGMKAVSYTHLTLPTILLV